MSIVETPFYAASFAQFLEFPHFPRLMRGKIGNPFICKAFDTFYSFPLLFGGTPLSPERDGMQAFSIIGIFAALQPA